MAEGKSKREWITEVWLELPGLTAKGVMEEVEKRSGLKVSQSSVNNIKGELKKGTGSAKQDEPAAPAPIQAAPSAPPGAAPGAAGNVLDTLREVRQLAQKVGGKENLKEILEQLL